MNQKPQQRMNAPGIIRAPEKRESSTSNQLAIVGIVVICFTLCLCASVIGPPRPDQISGPVIMALLLISSPLWGGLVILGAKLYISNTKRTPQAELRDAQQFVDSAEHQRQQRAAQAVTHAPESLDGPAGRLGVIGVPIIGDLPWCANNWLTLPAPELATHGIVIGASGTGKTVSLLRLAYIASAIYGYRVFFVDGKGDRDTAAQFLTIMHQAGQNPRMFPRQQYDGWKGDGTAILNKLMGVLDFTEPYYEDAAQDILTTVCLRHPSGPPTSSSDLLARLNAMLTGKQTITTEGVILRYRSFFGALNGALDTGFSFETSQAAYILLDGLALKKQAASLGRFLIEDFAQYAARRKQPGRDLLIVDEYSAISNGADAANLIERIRSYGCAVVLSSQSYAGLGEERDAERILDAANFLMVHRTAAPERLTARAGTQQQLKEMRQFGGSLDEHIYDRGRAQFEEEHALHPDQARRLQTGQALMIAHGRYVKANIAPAPAVDPALVEKARAWIDQANTTNALGPAPAPAQPAQPPGPPTGTGPTPAQPISNTQSQPLVRQIIKPAPQIHSATYPQHPGQPGPTPAPGPARQVAQQKHPPAQPLPPDDLP